MNLALNRTTEATQPEHDRHTMNASVHAPRNHGGPATDLRRSGTDKPLLVPHAQSSVSNRTTEAGATYGRADISQAAALLVERLRKQSPTENEPSGFDRTDEGCNWEDPPEEYLDINEPQPQFEWEEP